MCLWLTRVPSHTNFCLCSWLSLCLSHECNIFTERCRWYVPWIPHKLLLNPCKLMDFTLSGFVPWNSCSSFSRVPFFSSMACFLSMYELNIDGFWILSMLVMGAFPLIDWWNIFWTVLYSWVSRPRLTKWRTSSFPLSSRGWGSHSAGRGNTVLRKWKESCYHPQALRLK